MDIQKVQMRYNASTVNAVRQQHIAVAESGHQHQHQHQHSGNCCGGRHVCITTVESHSFYSLDGNTLSEERGYNQIILSEYRVSIFTTAYAVMQQAQTSYFNSMDIDDSLFFVSDRGNVITINDEFIDLIHNIQVAQSKRINQSEQINSAPLLINQAALEPEMVSINVLKSLVGMQHVLANADLVMRLLVLESIAKNQLPAWNSGFLVNANSIEIPESDLVRDIAIAGKVVLLGEKQFSPFFLALFFVNLSEKAHQIEINLNKNSEQIVTPLPDIHQDLRISTSQISGDEVAELVRLQENQQKHLVPSELPQGGRSLIAPENKSNIKVDMAIEFANRLGIEATNDKMVKQALALLSIVNEPVGDRNNLNMDVVLTQKQGSSPTQHTEMKTSQPLVVHYAPVNGSNQSTSNRKKGKAGKAPYDDTEWDGGAFSDDSDQQQNQQDQDDHDETGAEDTDEKDSAAVYLKFDQ